MHTQVTQCGTVSKRTSCGGQVYSGRCKMSLKLNTLLFLDPEPVVPRMGDSFRQQIRPPPR